MKHKTRKKRIVRRKRRVVRRNPYITKDDGQRVLYGYAKNGMELLGTGLKISKGNLVLLTPATNIPGGGYFARPGYPTGLWKQVSEDASIYIRPSDFKNDITFKKPVFGSKSFERMIRANSGGRYTGRGIARNSRRAFPTPRFVGKGEFIWKKISRPQRINFLMESFGNQITDRSKEMLATRAWSFLPSKVKIVFSSKVANVESDEYMYILRSSR